MTSRTLIVYLHGIGDNIMLTGVLREYHRVHSGEVLDLVVLNRGCAAVWANNPAVASIRIYEGRQPYFWNPVEFRLGSWWRVRREIREWNRDDRYARVLFPAIQTWPEILYHVTGTYGSHKILRIAREFGLAKKLYPYDLYPGPDDVRLAAEALAKAGIAVGSRLAVVHPFSGHAVKRLSHDGVRRVLQNLQEKGYVPLVVGSQGERSMAQPSWPGSSVFGLGFGPLIEVLRQATIFAGTDSAVAHLAAFAETPHVVVMSPKLKPERYLPVTKAGQVKVVSIREGAEKDWLNQFGRVLVLVST